MPAVCRRRYALPGLLLVGAGLAVACAAPAPEQVAMTGAWAPPPDSMIPADSLGASIRRGLALMVDTRDSLPGYALSNLNCTSCHLDGGRTIGAAPLWGAVPRFPRYLDRAGAVIPVEDRINYCMTRSLAGHRLPSDSREMQDMVAYLAFLAKGLPVGASPDSLGIPDIPVAAPDTTRGRELFATTCASCHGTDGAGGGVPRAPALWGPRSYSIGASMARVAKAAAFIRHNMPQTAPGSLTDQQAWDVAAYIDAQARPDMPGKELDWPYGGAPDGTPYPTTGRETVTSPPLLPRAQPDRALVPPPTSVLRP